MRRASVCHLRDGTANGVPAEEGSDAVRLLAERKIFDAETEEQLGAYLSLIEGGAEPEAALDFASLTLRFEAYRKWLHEWREVARATFNQRHILISLGLASRRHGESEDAEPLSPAVEPAPVSVHWANCTACAHPCASATRRRVIPNLASRAVESMISAALLFLSYREVSWARNAQRL